jgi:ABC-2 type transport system permease protein
MLSTAIGFLPSLLLSGLMFPISSMPKIFQYLTMVLPPRYFITFIESEFMAGTIWNIVLINSIFLTALGLILFVAVYKKTAERLEG